MSQGQKVLPCDCVLLLVSWSFEWLGGALCLPVSFSCSVLLWGREPPSGGASTCLSNRGRSAATGSKRFLRAPVLLAQCG